MSNSPLIIAIQNRLRETGYRNILIPVKVAGVEFAFTAAMCGSDGRSLDLVILVDTTTGDFGDRNGARVRQRIEAFSRALDVTSSRYVVTVILAGAALTEGVEALAEICRVLQVDGISLNEQHKPNDTFAERLLDDRIRVLLPLTLPSPIPDTQNSSGPAIEQLVRALPTNIDKSLVDAVIIASNSGEQEVSDAATQIINSAFLSKTEGSDYE
jgi:hypothetical protein